ncbi:MAG: hypothetical protein EKK37_16420 [Sphingobacteriales bacterium]|nr:MAG: hypothetical protein EKK37_16420 [Sphingobacteriales bacterium]
MGSYSIKSVSDADIVLKKFTNFKQMICKNDIEFQLSNCLWLTKYQSPSTQPAKPSCILEPGSCFLLEYTWTRWGGALEKQLKKNQNELQVAKQKLQEINKQLLELKK